MNSKSKQASKPYDWISQNFYDSDTKRKKIFESTLSINSKNVGPQNIEIENFVSERGNVSSRCKVGRLTSEDVDGYKFKKCNTDLKPIYSKTTRTVNDLSSYNYKRYNALPC